MCTEFEERMCVILYWLCVCVVLGVYVWRCVLGWSCGGVGVLMLRVSAPAGDDVSKKRDCYEILV